MKIRRILIVLLAVSSLAWFSACKPGSETLVQSPGKTVPTAVAPAPAGTNTQPPATTPAITAVQPAATAPAAATQAAPATGAASTLPTQGAPAATTADAQPAPFHIDASSAGFSPPVVKIAVGVTVAWGKSNCCDGDFSIVGDSVGFDGGFVSPDTGFSFTFTKAGTYNYHLVGDPGITGTIIVGG